ncbi:hypothetical protein GFH30_11160 [Acinetobacter wanghuae]|uniref:Toxin CptA n=1 Tax=Acinetobacter wanghuae TaxID=2662362 RepID=A0A5Q0P8B6_9GAMM|nr:hypothetical protein [Acinetobacter wanghuae]MQW92478.1 hypothetical protein [Acinetobacter wanghuae]QGA11888.1 hypothetical protein GFH30_11160 [Acinetobacter wanghuae]
MDSRCFKLKRSWFALAFQLLIFVLLMFVLYQVLALVLWVVCAVAGLVVYRLFYRKSPQIDQFEHLDGREWSITLQQHTQRVMVSHVIDHQVYVVVYFQHAKVRPLLIWCDQLPMHQWKALKVLTKLV